MSHEIPVNTCQIYQKGDEIKPCLQHLTHHTESNHHQQPVLDVQPRNATGIQPSWDQDPHVYQQVSRLTDPIGKC